MEQILTPSELDKLPALLASSQSAFLLLYSPYTSLFSPSNLPLPLSLTSPFILFLWLPFFSPSLCPCLSFSLSLSLHPMPSRYLKVRHLLLLSASNAHPSLSQLPLDFTHLDLPHLIELYSLNDQLLP